MKYFMIVVMTKSLIKSTNIL